MEPSKINFRDIVNWVFPTGPDDKYLGLTSGLSVFLIIFYGLSLVFPLEAAVALDPWALVHLNLGKLTNYPLAHLSMLHLLLNIICLYGPLARFEQVHGTVYTGITLNILALVTAIPYCIFGMVLYPLLVAVGASAWIFSLIAWSAHQSHLVQPVIRINSNFSFPVLYYPFVFLVIVTLLSSNLSFWGHLFGIVAGYLYSYGYLDLLIVPPTKKVVPFIEAKLDFLIQKIPLQFRFIRETSIVESRNAFYRKPMLPINVPRTPAPESSGFQGKGHTLNNETQAL